MRDETGTWRIEIPEYGPDVFCDFSERVTFTRSDGHTAFCSDCGATDHDIVKGKK